jgi:hypothetical protein
MAKFNYTNPNSPILESFVDEWPEPVADLESDVDYDMAEDELYDEIEDEAAVVECDGKDCDPKDKETLTEADDEEEEVEEAEEEAEEATEEAEEAEDEAEDAEADAEEAEEEVEEEETEEPSNISTEDFLSQIRAILDDNLNDLEADDVDEDKKDSLTAFNDGLNKAFDLVKEFLQPADDEEPEITEIDAPEETADETVEEPVEADVEVADEVAEPIADGEQFEFPEDDAEEEVVIVA